VRTNGRPAMHRLQNPFLPVKNPKTGRWLKPVVSLRRQADMVKAAKASGTVSLIPPGPKLGVQERAALIQANPIRGTRASLAPPPKDVEKAKRRREREESSGLAHVKIQWLGEVKERVVPGADIGARLYAGKKRMFKGHKWQRMQLKRKKHIGARVRDMDKRVERFKTNYKRRRPNPLGRFRLKKKESLPF